MSPEEVGHNIYILAHQLAKHSAELNELLKVGNVQDDKARKALEYYSELTAEIQVSTVQLLCTLKVFG